MIIQNPYESGLALWLRQKRGRLGRVANFYRLNINIFRLCGHGERISFDD